MSLIETDTMHSSTYITSLREWRSYLSLHYHLMTSDLSLLDHLKHCSAHLVVSPRINDSENEQAKHWAADHTEKSESCLREHTQAIQASKGTCICTMQVNVRWVPVPTLFVVISRLSISSRPSNPLNAFLLAPQIPRLLAIWRNFKWYLLTYSCSLLT